MSNPSDGREKPTLYTLTVVLSSLVIGLPLLIGRLVEAVLDTTNPAGVDVAQPLAYLREILLWGFGSLGLLVLVIVVLLVLLYRRTRTLKTIALPLLVFAVQVAVGVVTLVLSSLAN